MTIGESIQKNREKSGLSQTELGKILLVSEQTISLWEKDQAVPTIDDLMRLKEIFGVSVDEISGVGNEIQTQKNEPSEVYKFHYSETELKQIQHSQVINFYKKPVIFTLILALLFIIQIIASAPGIIIGIIFGSLFVFVISLIKSINTYKKAWTNTIKRVCESIYEYKIFKDHIIINIYRNNEKIRESKCYFTDIEHVQRFDKWILLQYCGQLFILRENELQGNSLFYSLNV